MTPVYWNNLNVTNDWNDPANWSYDPEGDLPLSSFSTDEYFLWEGITSGASDACDLSAAITCTGFDMLSATCAITTSAGAAFTISGGDDASSPSGIYTVNVTANGGGSFTCGGFPPFEIWTNTRLSLVGSQYDIGIITSFGTGTIVLGDSTGANGATININYNNPGGTSYPITLSNGMTLEVGGSCVVSMLKSNSQVAIRGSGGGSFVDLTNTSTGSLFEVYNCDTSNIFGADITLSTAAGTGFVSLRIIRGPVNSTLPQWAVDQTNNGGSLQLDFLNTAYATGSTISGSWLGLDLMDGGDWERIFFSGAVTNAYDVAIAHKFAGASPIAFSCVDFFMSCGPKNTTAHRIYSAGDDVTVTISNSLETSGLGGTTAADVAGNIQFGLSWGTLMTVHRMFIPGVQGWDSTSFPRDVLLTGAPRSPASVDCTALGTNAYLDSLTCDVPYRPIYFAGGAAVDASPGSLIFNMHGKFDLPANSLRYRTAPAGGTYRINLVAGAGASDVIALVGAILPW